MKGHDLYIISYETNGLQVPPDVMYWEGIRSSLNIFTKN